MRGAKCRQSNHYDTEAWADKAARRYEAKHGWAFRSYQCPECDQWHLARKTHGGLPVLLLDHL